VVGVEAGLIQRFDLLQPQIIDFLERHPLYGLNMIKDTELQRHGGLLSQEGARGWAILAFTVRNSNLG
jgi:hypothetical protein